MSHREGHVRLRHMLEHSREAAALIAGKERSDLDTDRVLNLALVRLLEIVGEAASRATEEERRLCPSIPWARSSACGIGLSTDTIQWISTCCGASLQRTCRS